MSRRALGLAAVFVLLVLSLLPRPSAGSHVDPVYVDYNASCSDLAPAGTDWDQMRVDTVEDGSFSAGGLTVSLDVHDGDDATIIDWSSNVAIDGVFVKGGPGGNFYHYNAPASGDGGLLPPVNPNNGKHYSPSHLLFCTTIPDVPTPTPPSSATFTPSPTASHTAPPTGTTMPSETPTLTPPPTGTAMPSETPTLTPSPTATSVDATATPNHTATPLPNFIRHVYFPAICINCGRAPGEPNDSCMSAHAMQPDTLYNFYADDGHDWYRFNLASPGEVEIRVSNFVPLAGQVAAYNGDGCESAHFLQNYGKPTLEKILYLGPQPAGTYFVYISNDGNVNTTDAYRIFVETR